LKRETLFLKVVIFLIGIPILGLCIFGLPSVANEAAEHYPAYLLYPVLIGMYAATVPFFFALYQTLKILSYIDKNKAFSELSIKALKNIKYCAITISSHGTGRRRPRSRSTRIGYYFCFNCGCSLCCCSSKAIKKCYRYKIRK